jgi:beta-lactamase superfamily II metal-dependent hydrolase
MRTHQLLTAAVAGLAVLVASGLRCAIAQTRTTLDIYVVDVEGGNATLFVAPSGESLLIDTGNVGRTRRSEMPGASWRRLAMPR